MSCPMKLDSGDSGVDMARETGSLIVNSGTDYNGSDSNCRLVR